jgi:hypothetical protein
VLVEGAGLAGWAYGSRACRQRDVRHRREAGRGDGAEAGREWSWGCHVTGWACDDIGPQLLARSVTPLDVCFWRAFICSCAPLPLY